MGEDFGGEERVVVMFCGCPFHGRVDSGTTSSGVGAEAVADGEVEAPGVEDVAEHDFAGLEGGLAETDFEEFENADFGVEGEFVAQEAGAEDALEFFDEGVFGVEEGDEGADYVVVFGAFVFCEGRFSEILGRIKGEAAYLEVRRLDRASMTCYPSRALHHLRLYLLLREDRRFCLALSLVL